MFFHEGIGYKYNFIQPVTLNRSITDGAPLSEPLPPHVQPVYYAAIIVAEALGAVPDVKITEIEVESDVVAGYALYDGDGKLVRAVFINSEAYEGGGNRSIAHLDFGRVEDTLQVKAKRLAIGYVYPKLIPSVNL
jgi:hypothetical protein